MKNLFCKMRLVATGLLLTLAISSSALAGCVSLMGYKLEDPAPEAIKFIKLITDTVGVKLDFEVRAVNFSKRTPIAMTTRCWGKSYILYDKHNFLWFGSGRTDFKTAGILIHEVGHNFSGDLGGISRKPWQRELTADYLAGFVIARLGGTRLEAISFTQIFNEEGSDSHPPRTMRIKAAQDGWDKSRSNMKWERKQCFYSEWIGKPFEIKLRTYRQLRLCRAGKLEYSIAQKTSEDEWHIQKLSEVK
jgi:hypothetical protein